MTSLISASSSLAEKLCRETFAMVTVAPSNIHYAQVNEREE